MIDNGPNAPYPFILDPAKVVHPTRVQLGGSPYTSGLTRDGY